jgi:opacity protein-like surface antigen
MKNFLGSLGILALGAFLNITTAHAQYRSFVTRDAGFYWRTDAGAAIPMDGHVTEFGPFSSGQRITYDTGFSFDAGFGYFFNKYVGTEVEAGWTWNYINSIEGAYTHDTYFGTGPILANVILQYPIPQTIVTPYIGAGVGGAVTLFDAHDFSRPVPGGSVSLHGSESDFVFAWQGSAGVRFDLNPKMSLGIGYRFLHTDPSTFSYESYHHGPTLDFGISSHESHIVAVTFLMKL